ncbi:MAG: hypothetical protein JWM80_2581 [Cyanobacteria bacterium RYN_339]|nr:hypothetical protein [Cyanobacteria bacterium RYN_339]
MTTQQIASRYNVIKTLGEGGMGLVSLVEDTTNGQKVALKVLSAKLGATEETILQFKQEFRIMTQLQHPNCCAVYDFGLLPEGAPYFTMEVVPGHGLDEILPLDGEKFKSVFSQLLLALGYVHQQGFVHCDIKDENARVTPEGVVKLMDFGLMERAGRAGGAIKGTLGYMAPEMAKGGRLDQRADLYSVGCLGYQMLTGQLPFPSQNPVEIIKAHINDNPTPVSKLNADIDPLYEKIITKLMQKEPLARYQSAFDVLEDLGIEVAEGMGGNLLSAPFVGREQELGTLVERLGDIAKGKPGAAILISGPAGAGKSRLAEEFRFQVQMENLPFVVGSSYEQGTAPYGPFVEGLRGLLPALKASVPDEMAKYAPILVKLLPELQCEPAPDLDPPSKEKMRLQVTITEVFAALSKKKGITVVLDDWQWADPLSSELLTYILRNTKDSAILFVLNHRNAPEGEPSWLSATTQAPLPALTPTEIQGMISSMLGTDVIGEAFLGKIVEFAEGNPFFVEGLLEHLVRNKTLVKTKGKWNSDIVLTPDQMPSNLQGLLLEKLEALSEDAMTLARIGAVLGRDFGLDVLNKVAGLSEDKLFDALGSLGEQAIFTQNENKTYRFAQGQLQEVLYANIEAGEKTRLHTAVAEALESQIADISVAEATMEQISAIANHYLLSNVADKTITYALEGGMRSAALFANADAYRFLTGGLELVKADGTTRYNKPKLDYLRFLGDVCRVSGKSDVAKEAFGEAIPLAEELGETFHLGRMLTSMGKVFQMSNDYPSALTYTGRSEEVCEAGGDKPGLARCLLTSCRINFFSGKQGEALEQTLRALALAKDADVKTYIGEALGFIGLMYVSSDPDKLEEGANNLNESVAILTELGDKIGLNNSLNLLGNAQNMQGDFLDAWGTFQQNQKICAEIGLKDEEIFALLNLAITAFELGHFADAIKMALEANKLATELNSKFPLGMAMTLEAAASAFTGQMGRARDLAQEALDLSREIKNKYLEALVMQYQVEILLYLGRLDEAKVTGEQLFALIKETGNTEPESRLQALIGEIQGRQGDPDASLEQIELALKASEAAHAKGIQVRALKAKSWWSLQAGKIQEAGELSERALAIANRIGAKFQTVQIRGLLGEIGLAGGDPSGAAKHFQAQQAAAEEMGSGLYRASALFGQAATNPHAKSSKAQVVEAQKLLKNQCEALDADGRTCFLSLPERQRIVDGNLAALSGNAAAAPAAGAANGPIGERLARISRELLDVSSQYSAGQEALVELEAETERANQVLEFAEQLGAIRNFDKAMGTALDRIMALMQAERGYIILESDEMNGQVMRSIRPDGGYQADWAFAGKLADQAKLGSGVLVTDVSEDERTKDDVKAENLQIQTALSVPIRLGEKLLGVMYLDRESTDGILFGDSELYFAQRLAGQGAIALKNAALATESIQRSRQLEMLNELAEKINETLVVEEVLDLVVKLTLEVTKADRGFLMLRSDDNPDDLVCKAAFDLAGTPLVNERISMSICKKVLTSGQAVTVVDATMDEEFQTAKSIMSLNLRTLMCVPLQAKGKSLGVLYVDSQAVVNTFSEKDLDLLKSIAGHSSGAIENATLYSSLNTRAAELEEALAKYRKAEHEATTDMLTGLHNRRYFQDQSAREIELSKRHHRNMSVIMLDVDHFKKFNDTYGHAIGDEVLKVMGKVLPETVRLSDIPARYGGEEFVVLCPDTDSQGAAIVAERIRHAISQVKMYDLEGKPVRQITASLGVASLTPADERVAEMLERADTALYACKAGGRNQIQIWREGMLTPEELKKKEQKEIEEKALAEEKANKAKEAAKS